MRREARAMAADDTAQRRRLFRRHRTLAAILPGLSVFIVYIVTLAPTVTGEDSGELITAAYYFGVPHPPGYPLWTMLCGAWTHLVPFGNVASRANLFSAVCMAVGVTVLAAALRRMGFRAGCAGCAAAAAGLTAAIWSQSVIAEVYTLHLLIVAILLWLAARWNRDGETRWLGWGALVVGLGLSNHHLIGFVALGLAAWALFQRPALIKDAALWIRCAALLLLGLTPYLYLLWAGGRDVPVKWGETDTLAAVWEHVSRGQYKSEHPIEVQVPMTAGLMAGRLYYGLRWEIEQFTPWLTPLLVAGLIWLWRRRSRRSYFWLVILVGIACGPLFLYVGGPRLNRQDQFVEKVFLTPIALFSAVPLAAGLHWLRAASRQMPVRWGRRFPQQLNWFGLVIVPLALMVAHWRDNNMRDYWYAYDHGRNLLAGMLPKAIVIPSGDHNTFPVIYLIHVEGIRPDVTVADKYGYIDLDLYRDMPNNPGKPRTPEERDEIERWIIRTAGRPIYYTVKKPSLVDEAKMFPVGLAYHLLPDGHPMPAGLSRITSTINQGPDGTFANGDDLTTQYAYDAVGRQVTLTNEAGRFTVSEFNPLGRKTRVTEDSAGLARITDSQFDRSGRLNKLIAYTDGTSNPQTTSYAYNGRGLQTIVTYEETGNVTQAYDQAGNMTRRTDEAGIAVEYYYDELNRLIQRNKASAVANIEAYGYDGLGRLIDADIDDGAGTGSAFGYDALSRVTYENQTSGGTAKQINYTYDKGGNRISLKHDAWSKTLAYAYDSRDRCVQIDHVSGGTTVRMADYTWLGNAISRRDTTCDYPGSTKPKFKSDFARDGIQRITKITNEHLTYDQAGSTYGDLGTWDYTYDSGSNLLTADQTGSMGFLAVDNFHTYDTGDRLLTTRYTDPQAWDVDPIRTSWFSYDDLGNRISHKYRTSSAIGYAHDKANRMTTLANKTQEYDLAGNLTLAFSVDRGTSYKYKYDHHNRLTGVYDSTGVTRKAAFTWDALGRRVEFWNDVQLATTRYWYDGVNEVHSYRLSGTAPFQAHMPYVFVHGVSYIDERLAMINTVSNKPHYFVVDRMYNVRMLIDRAGAVVERYAYDSYGRPRIRESCGRGDLNDDTLMTSTDTSRFTSAKNGTIWDPRADMDDDGDVDTNDQTAYDAKQPDWASAVDATAVVAQAFSDINNPYMFQGVPHFALDTAANATEDKLSLNHHRARFADCPTGRWTTRDPYNYQPKLFSSYSQPAHKGQPLLPIVPQGQQKTLRSYSYLAANTNSQLDPSGLCDSPSQAPTWTQCDPVGIDGVEQGGCVEFDSCLIPCVYAHENTHVNDLSASCNQYQSDNANCTGQDCTLVREAFSDWRSPCNVAHEECNASSAELHCLTPCAESESCCSVICAIQICHGVEGRPSTNTKIQQNCGTAATCGPYREYQSPFAQSSE